MGKGWQNKSLTLVVIMISETLLATAGNIQTEQAKISEDVFKIIQSVSVKLCSLYNKRHNKNLWYIFSALLENFDILIHISRILPDLRTASPMDYGI